MLSDNSFPIAYFERVTHNTVYEQLTPSFPEFVNLMRSFSDEQFMSKNDAPLIASTSFINNKRSKANATNSGLIILDVDHGCSIEDALSWIEVAEVECLICSTASHRNEHHKFRVCLPLSKPVNYDLAVAAWKGINGSLVGGVADSSKAGSESLFYVPGRYPSSPQVFHHITGDIHSAEAWIDAMEIQIEPCRTFPAATGELPRSRPARASISRGLRSASDTDLNLSRSRLVSEIALNAYLSSVGNYHHARFTLMLSIASRAQKMSVALTEAELIDLFNQVDLADGGHYQTPKYQCEINNDARKVLNQIGV